MTNLDFFPEFLSTQPVDKESCRLRGISRGLQMARSQKQVRATGSLICNYGRIIPSTDDNDNLNIQDNCLDDKIM